MTPDSAQTAVVAAAAPCVPINSVRGLDRTRCAGSVTLLGGHPLYTRAETTWIACHLILTRQSQIIACL